jgi:prepilin-type N-terminal cleavage/methylation domain-containing protein
MKGQQGYTLVELAIALVITGTIATVLGLVAQQTVAVPARGNDQVNAAHAIQNAIHWVSLDGQTAKSASGGSTLTLTLPDDSTVTYTLEGDALHRVSASSNRTIAQCISEASFSVDGRLITMNLTAAPESRWNVSENGTYQISMRPSPE